MFFVQGLLLFTQEKCIALVVFDLFHEFPQTCFCAAFWLLEFFGEFWSWNDWKGGVCRELLPNTMQVHIGYVSEMSSNRFGYVSECLVSTGKQGKNLVRPRTYFSGWRTEPNRNQNPQNRLPRNESGPAGTVFPGTETGNATFC